MSEKVNVKLGGAMVKYSPQGAPGNKHSVDLPADKSVQSILDALQVPADQPLMVILNDAMIARTEYNQTLLADGDALSLMPPIQAG